MAEEARPEPERTGEYDADNIRVLGGIEHVRLRPAMYIGDTGERGLHHLIEEVVANSIDEAMAGYCELIRVELGEDGRVSVTDDGRGIPVDTHPEAGKPALEVVMTTLNAGGKFDSKSYSMSAGLHGVGVSCVNALSEWMEVEVWRDGHAYYQRYEKGVPQTEVERRGRTDRTGTRVTFMPDRNIFEDTDLNYDSIARRLRELAFLNSGVRIYLEAEGSGEEEIEAARSEEFHYEGGIREFVEFLNQGKNTLHDEVIYIERDTDDVTCQIAMQYNDGYNESVLSFANNINTGGGGTHLSGFRRALTRTLNAFGRDRNMLKDASPSGQDYREGLTAVISVCIADPQFEGQTKSKLGNRELTGVVQQIVNEALGNYCEENPGTARNIVEKAVEAARAREAAKKARELTRRKGALSSGNLPGKLRDCSSRKQEDTELFIVEGQSAGGTAGVGRDREFQAILPLRGVILNVEKARVDKMLGNEEISSLITALGTGIGEEEFNIDDLRYEKVVIMTDADIDGAHIRTLLLTFFFRQMPELIENGHLYIAQPPLYKVKRRGKEQYVPDDRALGRTLVELAASDSTLEYDADGGVETLHGEDLKRFLHLCSRLEVLLGRIEHRGMDVQSYLDERDEETGRFPIYRVQHTNVDGTTDRHVCYSEDDYDALIESVEQDLREREDVEDEEVEIIEEDQYGALYRSEGLKNTLRPRKITEASEISNLVGRIEELGISVDQFFRSSDDEPDEDEEAAFRLYSDGSTIPVYSLADIMPKIRELGREGLNIQRYKGLGEMDADELAETTLDPETRRLVRVTVGDAIKADNYFSILAGTNVKQRREFIERHALEVSHLDV